TVCVVGKMRDLILQLSKSSIYSTKPDECWKNGLRLDKSQSVHYQLLMETIRRTLIPRPK
ncbi:hypothetical protein QQX85_27955, partial [Klebsiella variicola]